eukprot:scaffold237119_cov17-Tisochrysis_lutea.AAC.1
MSLHKQEFSVNNVLGCVVALSATPERAAKQLQRAAGNARRRVGMGVSEVGWLGKQYEGKMCGKFARKKRPGEQWCCCACWNDVF